VNTKTALGFKMRIGPLRFRLWRDGFEIGNNFGGRIYFFPWSKPK